jgi:glyoxylase-like metal-dependent hydrolase (beta-lactamase superfamily II)
MKLHHLQGYIQSVYLVEYPDKLLLLDGCSRADVPMLKRFIGEQLQRPFTDLTMVLVTHMHPDHAGAAHELRRLVGCKIASANKDKPWYRGMHGMLMHLTDIALATWVAGRLGKPRKLLWYSPVLKPDYKLTDGQCIPGFEQWQVFEMPGHTDRDLSAMHMPSRRIYVADLIVKVKERFIAPFPVFYPNQYRASVQRLIELQPSSVLLAHGGEVQLTDLDYRHLLHSAPKLPKTPWRAIKIKARRLLQTNR